jgi:hypothetical protein
MSLLPGSPAFDFVEKFSPDEMLFLGIGSYEAIVGEILQKKSCKFECLLDPLSEGFSWNSAHVKTFGQEQDTTSGEQVSEQVQDTNFSCVHSFGSNWAWQSCPSLAKEYIQYCTCRYHKVSMQKSEELANSPLLCMQAHSQALVADTVRASQ